MKFDVKAIDAANHVVLLQLEAADETDARQQARQRGFHAVLGIRSQASLLRLSALAGRARFPLVQFSQEMLALLDAGLPLAECIEALLEKEPHPETRAVLEGVVSRLREGQSLSTAIQHFPAEFPPLYVATVRASERSGGLSEALTRYVAYAAQVGVVRAKLVSASIYPLLLISVGVLVMLFLLGYVVPKFSQIYADLGTDLPWMSRVLLQWGLLLESHGELLLVGLLAAGVLLVRVASRRSSRLWLERALWRVPAIGEHLAIYHLARLYRTVGMLLRGGIPIAAALDMARDMLPELLRARLSEARRRVQEGQPLSAAMDVEGLTTPIARRMLRVGERTGQMGEMMDRIARFYDDDIARRVEWFIKLFEPLLMIVIGAIIGIVVVLMYVPIFELAGSIQ